MGLLFVFKALMTVGMKYKGIKVISEDKKWDGNFRLSLWGGGFRKKNI
jgi:hypothetical protein